MANSTSSLAGISLTKTYAAISATTPDIPGLPFVVGTQTETTDGGLYIFVVAGSAIAQYDFVGISTASSAAPLSATTALTGLRVGVAQVAIGSGSYGWVAVSGGALSGNVLASAATSASLYATATAGSLDDAAGSSTYSKINGVVVTTTKNSVAGSTAVLLTNPTVEL